MICPICFGKKYDFKKDGNNGYFVECKKCHDTGIVESQTNEEWRRTCSAEKFAKWLSNTLYACMRCDMNCHIGYCPFNKCIIDKEDALKWLKQPHTSEE